MNPAQISGLICGFRSKNLHGKEFFARVPGNPYGCVVHVEYIPVEAEPEYFIVGMVNGGLEEPEFIIHPLPVSDVPGKSEAVFPVVFRDIVCHDLDIHDLPVLLPVHGLEVQGPTSP